MASSSCCEPLGASAEEVALEQALHEAEDDADATLAGCCQQELENMRKSSKLRAALLDVDRSTRRLKLHAQATPAQPPPAALAQAADSEADEDDDDDEMLSQLRQQRLQELQRLAQQQQQASARGYGQLNDVEASALLRRIEDTDTPCVVHLAVSGFEPCAELDEVLSGLAHQHRGTYFSRTPVTRRSPLQSQLRVAELPALLACCGGAIVGRAPLTQFGAPNSILEEEVVGYLTRLKVLASGARGPPQRPGAACSDQESGDEEAHQEAGTRYQPCEICGRSYPHEHVKAVYKSDQHCPGSDSDEGD